MIFLWANDAQSYFVTQGLITIGITSVIAITDYAYFELKLIRGRTFESILTTQLQAKLGLTRTMNVSEKEDV